MRTRDGPSHSSGVSARPARRSAEGRDARAEASGSRSLSFTSCTQPLFSNAARTSMTPSVLCSEPLLLGSGATPKFRLLLTGSIKPALVNGPPIAMPILPWANWLNTVLRSVASGFGWVRPDLVRFLRNVRVSTLAGWLIAHLPDASTQPPPLFIAQE